MIATIRATLAPYLFWLKLAGAAAVFGAGWYAESLRWEAADDKRIAAEAMKERDRQNLIRDEKEADTMRGYQLAQQAEAERKKLEVTYADAQAKLRKALQRPAQCPPGGTLGDVVIGSDALRELRRAAGQDRVPAPEPAASEPHR